MATYDKHPAADILTQ